MNRETILEEIDAGVALLTMNRPRRRNAFNDHQYDDLRDALADAQENDEVRAVVVTGAGGCLLYKSPSPRDRQKDRMPSSA